MAVFGFSFSVVLAQAVAIAGAGCCAPQLLQMLWQLASFCQSGLIHIQVECTALPETAPKGEPAPCGSVQRGWKGITTLQKGPPPTYLPSALIWHCGNGEKLFSG